MLFCSLLSIKFFANVEEAKRLVELMKSTDQPTAITMCIGPQGDLPNVLPREYAVRFARVSIEYVANLCLGGNAV